MHCRKTAGSSCTVYLNQFLGPEDIQTCAWKETLQAGGSYNNLFYKKINSWEGIRYGIKESMDSLCRFRLPKRASLRNSVHKSIYQQWLDDSPAHPRASTVKNRMPKEWESYLKFCFVRNPYERIVSDYHWRTRSSKRKITFSEFLMRIEDPLRSDPENVVPYVVDNWPMYTIDDRVVVDFIGRKERLIEDMASICERIGLPFDADAFVHAKKF